MATTRRGRAGRSSENGHEPSAAGDRPVADSGGPTAAGDEPPAAAAGPLVLPEGGGLPVAARIVMEVLAGPPGGEPDPVLTRRWAVTAAEWERARVLAAHGDPDAVARLLAEFNGRALGYAALLMLQPERLGWVRTNWIYL